MKFLALHNEIKSGIFGKVLGYIWVIEFQKRGLPHAHMLYILDSNSKVSTPEEYDSIISAEIPDEQRYPEAYETVTKMMVHGPCGNLNPRAPCMKDGFCTKKYPKNFQETTESGTNGYPIYRRRNNGKYILKNNQRIDNKWIVPHNLYLCTKYNAHINVEICSSISATKYLFKYVYKGHDRAIVLLEQLDEILKYIDVRYVSAAEAIWIIFGFKMHDHSPSVTRLQLHLPDQQCVVFNEDSGVYAYCKGLYYEYSTQCLILILYGR